MKNFVIFIVFVCICAPYAQDDDSGQNEIQNVHQEIVNETDGAKPDVSKKSKNKIIPLISLNKREITISAAGVSGMKISVFSVSGKKLAAKNVIGDKAAFTLPKSAKNAVIVQIDADRKFFSQKVVVE